jgi:AraC family transcriptional regulator, arabinose operon regulatory protein
MDGRLRWRLSHRAEPRLNDPWPIVGPWILRQGLELQSGCERWPSHRLWLNYTGTMRGFKHFFAVPPLQTRRLTIRGIGIQEAMPARVVDRPRGTGDYLLMYFHDPIWAASAELPSLQPAGTLMIWSPSRWQYYGDRTRPFMHSWMHCDGVIVRSLLKDAGVPVDQPVQLADASIIERHLQAIHEELARQPRPDAMIVRNLLDNMFRQVAREIRDAGKEKPISQDMLAVRNLIESEYHRQLPLSELARLAGLGISQFCETFRRHFGFAPHEYLQRHRMHQAAFLLRDCNMTVKGVARQVGYRSAFSFSTLFKQHFGVSPTAFRRREPDVAAAEEP